MITFIERLPHCPRCGGNLGREYDYDTGWDIVCLQCGHRRSLGVGPGSAESQQHVAMSRVESSHRPAA